MAQAYSRLLVISLVLVGCAYSVPAQSGRAPRQRTNNSQGTKSSAPIKDAATPALVKDARRLPIPVLVMLSRNRRLVMLPPSNQNLADRIAKSLRRDERLSVKFEPQKIKLEDAQQMLRAGMGTYMLLVRFEEFSELDKREESWRTDPQGTTSYKMDYTLLAPTGEIVKQKSIQTFFSLDRKAKPLFQLFVTNCLNTSRYSLDDSAVRCMTQHVLADLYDFSGPLKKK